MKPLLLLLLLTSAVWGQSSKTLVLENEFIKIIVNNQTLDKGRFAIETTGGDPLNAMDNNEPLIFGRPIPWTSYTTISVDDQNIVFGGENKKIRKRSAQEYSFGTVKQQEKTDQRITTLVSVTNNIEAEQQLSFLRNPSTRIKDAVVIAYDILNNDTVTHNIGIRIMLDTKLGNNDGAPLRMGTLSVSSEKEVFKKDLFPFWQAFDTLPSPNIVAQGTLELQEAQIYPPDRVVLANWGSLADYPGPYVVQEGNSFIRTGETEKDTALALYWDPLPVPPKGRRTVRTLYGLGGLSLSSGSLSLGLTAPAEYVLASQRDLFTVGYVSNISGFDAQNTSVAFTLPKGFDVVGGQSVLSLGTLLRGETRQIPLRIRPNQNTESGPHKLTFTVTSTTLESNQIQRNIDIIAPPKVQSQLTLSSNPISFKETEIQALVTITNPSQVPVENIMIGLQNTTALSLPSYEVPTKTIATVPPKGSVAVNWRIRLKTAPLSTTVSMSLLTPGYPVETLQATITPPPFTQQIHAQVLSTPNNTISRTSPFLLWLSGDPLLGKYPEKLSLHFDPTVLQFVHYAKPKWAANATLTPISPGHIEIEFPSDTVPTAAVPLGLLQLLPIGTAQTQLTLTSPAYPSLNITIPTPNEGQP